MFPYYDDIIAAMPEYDRYLGLTALEASTDRLAAAHPEVEVRTAGASRAGRPIRCLEIPGGPLHAVLVGAPHADEPAGALALECLLPLLAGGLAAELGFGFSVVKAPDPDATLVNESWFDVPGDLPGYLLSSYRPAPYDQFDRTFPAAHGRYAFTRALPEAAAVMDVIGLRPVDFYVGLRGGGVGGASFSLSSGDELLQEQLTAVVAAADLPLHRGEPDVPYAGTLAPGVFRAVTLADEYDYHAAFGADPAVVLTSGAAGDAYAASVWDCFTLVARVPRFTSPKVSDTGPAGLTRREAGLRGLEIRQRLAEWLHAKYVEAGPLLTRETPWQRTVHAFLAGVKNDLRAERACLQAASRFSEEATVAQLFDAVYLRELEGLRRVGQFASMVAAEGESGGALAELHAAAVAEVRDRAPKLAAAGGLRTAPIRSLVQTQAAALLCGLAAVRERYRPGRPRPPAPRASA